MGVDKARDGSAACLGDLGACAEDASGDVDGFGGADKDNGLRVGHFGDGGLDDCAVFLGEVFAFGE